MSRPDGRGPRTSCTACGRRGSPRTVSIVDHGARGDGVTKATAAIARAIDTVARAGGRRVLVPAGRFLTGAIHLKSNVELHLADGAVLSFSAW